jgi:hypothetical protein
LPPAEHRSRYVSLSLCHSLEIVDLTLSNCFSIRRRWWWWWFVGFWTARFGQRTQETLARTAGSHDPVAVVRRYHRSFS